MLVQLLALWLAQLPSQHLDQQQAQMLALLLAQWFALLLAQQNDMFFLELLQQPGDGAVTHRQPPIIDCVSNFGFFDVDSTHAVRQPRPGDVPASQGAVRSGRGEGVNHRAAVVSLPCGWLLLQC